MMQKTAADFVKLAQSHPFCAGFLVTALQRGLSEEEMQAGLLKAAASSPIREAEVDSFLQAAGVDTHVKMAADWGAKLKQMRNRGTKMLPGNPGLGNQLQKMRNWGSTLDPASKALVYTGGAAGTTALGLGAMDYMSRQGGPQPAESQQLESPQAADASLPPAPRPVPLRLRRGMLPGAYPTVFESPRPAASILGPDSTTPVTSWSFPFDNEYGTNLDAHKANRYHAWEAQDRAVENWKKPGEPNPEQSVSEYLRQRALENAAEQPGPRPGGRSRVFSETRPAASILGPEKADKPDTRRFDPASELANRLAQARAQFKAESQPVTPKQPAAAPAAKAPPEAPFRTTQSTAPLVEPKIPASISGPSYGDKANPQPAGPSWYTNPAVLGGGGLLALALLARNLGGGSRSKDEDDDEQDY